MIMSNIFSQGSLSMFPPFTSPLKPYPFPKLGSRSRTRKLSSTPPPIKSSSEDIVLISTTEHRDGSLVFRFGDASEVVENETKSRQESSVVTVLDGDQERQVFVKRIESGYGSDDVRVTDRIDGRETMGDSHEESSEEEVLSSLSEAKQNDSLAVVHDETDSTARLDGDQSSNPTISLFDENSNRDETADTNGTLVTDDPSVSAKFESMQVSKVDFMDVEKPYDENESDKVKSEDTSESDTVGLMLPASMPISDGELTDAANEDMEEGLQDTNITEGTLIDEMPPFDLLVEPSLDEVEVTMEVSSIEAVIVSDQVVEDELREASTNYKEEAELSVKEEEISQIQSVPLEVKPTTKVSDIELQDTTGQYPDDEILQVKEENDNLSVSVKPEIIKVSDIELQDTMGQNPDDKILQVTDESEDPSVSVKLETIQLSDIEFQDTVGPNPDHEILLVADESEDPSVSDKLEAIQISDIELPDSMGPNTDDGILEVTDKSEDLSLPSKLETIQVSDIKPQNTMGPDPDDGTLLITEESEEPSVSGKLETIQALDIELRDTTGQNSDDEILQKSNETEDPSVSVELETIQISNIEVINVTQPYAVDKSDKVETEDTTEGDTKDLLPSATIHNISDVEQTDAANVDMERLQDMKIIEGTLIDGMLSSDSIGSESTVDEVIQLQSSDVELEAGMQVSTTNDMDVKDWSVDDELQQVSIDNRDDIDVTDVMTFREQDSIPIKLKPTMQVSDVEILDAKRQNLDDGILQVINEETGDSLTMDVDQLSLKLEGQPVQDEGENHSISEQCVETDAPGISILLKQDSRDPLPEAEKTEENVSSSELAAASEESTLLFATEAKVKWEEIYLTGEFLSSGAAFLEHPFKALSGGNDAYFVAGGKWLGVANGVSRWSFEGTDPGVYAQELMKTCKDIVLNTRSAPVTNPVELLCSGVKETNISGSSNILIASFDGQALHVANIGDTGFLIIRHGAIYKKSSPLLHEFHFALQVKDCDDPLQLLEECTIELEEGDIVVSATDGLFDNLYEREIAMIVSKSLKAEMRPQEIANVLATRAQEVGKSAFVRSPFSDAAQAAGYSGYTGGKPDNVAVIVSLVEKRSNLLGD